MNGCSLLASMVLGQVPTPCDVEAEAFLDGAPFASLPISTSVLISGPRGDADLMFTSGTNLSAVTAAINSMSGVTGIHANAVAENPQRLRMASVFSGAEAFVSVAQVGGDEPRLYSVSVGGTAVWRLIAHGEAGVPGDADCDGTVDIADVTLVIEHWGPCVAPAIGCPGDLDFSGHVNIDDLLLVISNWGSSAR